MRDTPLGAGILASPRARSMRLRKTVVTRIQAPTLSIGGEHDRLVPTSASVYLAEQVGNGRAQIIRGAGHAPFLTHTTTVSRLMESFIHEY